MELHEYINTDIGEQYFSDSLNRSDVWFVKERTLYVYAIRKGAYIKVSITHANDDIIIGTGIKYYHEDASLKLCNSIWDSYMKIRDASHSESAEQILYVIDNLFGYT